MQWIAADPVAYDPTEHMVTAWAGVDVPSGRAYDLVYDREYDRSTTEPGPTLATIDNDGDVPVSPLLRVYGPAHVARRLRQSLLHGGGLPRPGRNVVRSPSSASTRTRHVTVDTANHTAYCGDDPTDVSASVVASIDWTITVWPVVLPNESAFLEMTADDGNYITQVSASWRSGFLS